MSSTDAFTVDEPPPGARDDVNAMYDWWMKSGHSSL
jgi:hypothetical protein